MVRLLGACALEGLQVRLAPPLHLGKFIVHRVQTLQGKRDIFTHLDRMNRIFDICIPYFIIMNAENPKMLLESRTWVAFGFVYGF